MFSAVHPTTDIAKILRHVSNVPPEAEPIRILRLDPPAPTMGHAGKDLPSQAASYPPPKDMALTVINKVVIGAA